MTTENISTIAETSHSRRSALGFMARALAIASVPVIDAAQATGAPSVVDGDAELLRLGAEFDGAYAEWVPLCMEWKRLEALCSEELARQYGERAGLERWWALRTEMGVEIAGDANDAAIERANILSSMIRDIPATTLAGLAVKARVVRFDSFSPWEFVVPEEDMDWGPLCFQRFLAELEHLARDTRAA